MFISHGMSIWRILCLCVCVCVCVCVLIVSNALLMANGGNADIVYRTNLGGGRGVTSVSLLHR